MGLQLIQKPTYLEAQADGPFDLEHAIAGTAHVLSVCRSMGLDKVLVDIRDVQEPDDLSQRFAYALEVKLLLEDYLASGAPPLRFAYLVKPGRVQEFRPGYDFAQRHGMPSFLTDDIEAALSWLHRGGKTPQRIWLTDEHEFCDSVKQYDTKLKGILHSFLVQNDRLKPLQKM